MFGKGTKLHSVIGFKCPHCQEGDFYVDNNPYHLAHVGDVRTSCAVCGRRFEREPGFYYGGMYVAYGLGVALFVGVYLAISWLWPASAMWVRVSAILTAMVVLGPLLYALSKIIWANLFMQYKGVALTPAELEQQARERP